MSDLTGEKATEPMTSNGSRRNGLEAGCITIYHAWVCIGPQRTENGGQRFGSVEELGGRNGIVLVSVDWNIDKGPFKGLHDGATGRDNGSRHAGLLMVLQTSGRFLERNIRDENKDNRLDAPR